MKKIYTLLAVTLFLTGSVITNAQTICDSTGNIIIYSNYDGLILNINVDQDIPNLKFGIVSYEPVTINFVGPYVGNITEVRYAGYVSTQNHHCSNPDSTTRINGVPANIDTIIFAPPAGYSNPNGWSEIICNYSCSDSTNQGGCNTPDQLVHYFETVFNGHLRYHYTQYGCWNPNYYNISAGGNCCAIPLTTGINEINNNDKIKLYPNPANANLEIQLSKEYQNSKLEIFSILGEKIKILNSDKSQFTADISSLPSGFYILKVISINNSNPDILKNFIKE